jgi:hypothetical protein
MDERETVMKLNLKFSIYYIMTWCILGLWMEETASRYGG